VDTAAFFKGRKKMDIGLYNMKYPVRRFISGVLPLVKDVSPNTVSLSMVPVGAAVAACYYFALEGRPVFYLGAMVLTLVRMFLGTLDGLMAEHYKKGTPNGEIVNRLAPEICDVLYLSVLALARSEWMFLGVGGMAVAWLTTFAGLVGLAAKKTTQSVGPVGQTDRLAALLVLTLLAYLSERFYWGVDFIRIFLVWTIAGGVVTIILRLNRHFRN
jgi:CDP-diacylglycerol--glycerol-3-phosphate 3-phosphatidyltransferase